MNPHWVWEVVISFRYENDHHRSNSTFHCASQSGEWDDISEYASQCLADVEAGGYVPGTPRVESVRRMLALDSPLLSASLARL